jgi:hypothetical protein
MRGDLLTAATLVTLLFGSQMVRADQITTTTVEQTAPAVLPIEPIQADSHSRSITIETKPAATTSYSISKYSDFGGPEHYRSRLNKMRDQISLGLARGYITQGENDRLMSQYNELASLESNICANGFTKAESDDLEKRMNMFNVRISHSLSYGMRTAGAGSVQ